MGKSVKERTTELMEPILAEKNLDLFDIEYVKEGPNWFLRVYIDKEDGVSIDECEFVSNQLSELLDQEDFIPGSYMLEVSSPGVERPLKSKQDFQNSVGKHIYVSLYAPVDGEKVYEGLLKSFNNEIATIEYQVLARKKQVEIPYEKIAKSHLTVAL